MEPSDRVRFHSLHKDGGGIIVNSSASSMAQIEPNMILRTFSGLYDREIERSLAEPDPA